MSSDAGYDFDDPIYRQLEKEASRDARAGEHEFMVTDVTQGTWPSGDPFLKISGVLTTANNSKASLTISPLPSKEEIKAGLAGGWDSKRIWRVNNTKKMYEALADHYKTDTDKISQGDLFKVKTSLTRVDKQSGKGGFVQIDAFLDPKKVLGAKKAESDPVPF